MPHETLKARGKNIICMVNQKGGVGKTASVVSIGSGLALAGQKTLLIDGDPQGNLTLFFHEDPSSDLSVLLQDLIQGSPSSPEKYIVPAVRENLDILPNFNRQLRLMIQDRELMGVQEEFSLWISRLKEKYSWIIFDCSPSNGPLENLIVSSCEAVLVPLEFQLFSVSGLNSLIEEIRNCGKQLKKSILIEALIFTKVEKKLNRVQEYRNIFSQFYIPIYEICKSEYLPSSLELKKTLWEHSPSSFVAKDYYQIIEKSFLGNAI